MSCLVGIVSGLELADHAAASSATDDMSRMDGPTWTGVNRVAFRSTADIKNLAPSLLPRTCEETEELLGVGIGEVGERIQLTSPMQVNFIGEVL